MAGGAEFILTGDTMTALVRKGNSHWLLHPQFLTAIDGVRQYTSQPTDDTQMFAGWLPYKTKRWPIASDKLAFKRFAKSTGLSVPDFAVDGKIDIGDVVIKRAISSFGDQIRGPFRSVTESPLDIAQGEYYERFTRGDLLKVWFWNGTPVCAERDKMPFVAGDGVSTLGQLIISRARYSRPYSPQDTGQLLHRCAPLLHYCGVTDATILSKGKRQLIEYRYGSDLMHPRNRRILDLRPEAREDWTHALDGIGRNLYTALPGDLRTNTLFTVDAILDSEQAIWLLEMNSNPTVHPLAYPDMMNSLLSQGAVQESPSPLPSRTPEQA
ncbi:hypothetical protein CS8_012930 [Cupriavidus sp. 8B]